MWNSVKKDTQSNSYQNISKESANLLRRTLKLFQKYMFWLATLHMLCLLLNTSSLTEISSSGTVEFQSNNKYVILFKMLFIFSITFNCYTLQNIFRTIKIALDQISHISLKKGCTLSKLFSPNCPSWSAPSAPCWVNLPGRRVSRREHW